MYSPHPEPPPPPSTPYPSGFSQSTSFGYTTSCTEHNLVIYFTHGNVYASMLFFQIIPPSPSPTEPKSLFFISVSPLLPRMQDHWYHLSEFHIYVLMYSICLSLSDLLSFIQQAPGSSTSLELAQMHSFLQLSSIPLCIHTTTSLSILLPMDIQFITLYQRIPISLMFVYIYSLCTYTLTAFTRLVYVPSLLGVETKSVTFTITSPSLSTQQVLTKYFPNDSRKVHSETQSRELSTLREEDISLPFELKPPDRESYQWPHSTELRSLVEAQIGVSMTAQRRG